MPGQWMDCPGLFHSSSLHPIRPPTSNPFHHILTVFSLTSLGSHYFSLPPFCNLILCNRKCTEPIFLPFAFSLLPSFLAYILPLLYTLLTWPCCTATFWHRFPYVFRTDSLISLCLLRKLMQQFAPCNSLHSTLRYVSLLRRASLQGSSLQQDRNAAAAVVVSMMLNEG